MSYYFCAVFTMVNLTNEMLRTSDAFKVRHIAKHKCFRAQGKCLKKVTKLKPVWTNVQWEKRYSWECVEDPRLKKCETCKK